MTLHNDAKLKYGTRVTSGTLNRRDILALKIFSPFFNLDTKRNFYFSSFPSGLKTGLITKD